VAVDEALVDLGPPGDLDDGEWCLGVSGDLVEDCSDPPRSGVDVGSSPRPAGCRSCLLLGPVQDGEDRGRRLDDPGGEGDRDGVCEMLSALAQGFDVA
jgi:hypothetical protein